MNDKEKRIEEEVLKTIKKLSSVELNGQENPYESINFLLILNIRNICIQGNMEEKRAKPKSMILKNEV